LYVKDRVDSEMFNLNTSTPRSYC